MKTLNYKQSQYKRSEYLIISSDIFNYDTGSGVFKGKPYPFVLNNNLNNLYAPFGAAILEYFSKNSIAWWNGYLTSHTLSSQVACLNHLFPIRNDKSAVLSILSNINPDIVDVLTINSDEFSPAYIQFESVSDIDHLNEKTSTRGSNCTSVDALMLGVHKDGRRILLPIEWKYVEAYGNENKAVGDPGKTRKSRYENLIDHSEQLHSTSHDIYYFEPFYQLMRQTLWAEQMISNKATETVKADDYIHIHVIPSENHELLKKIYPCSNNDLEGTWRSCLKDQNKYRIISPRDLFSSISSNQYHLLTQYLEKRYW